MSEPRRTTKCIPPPGLHWRCSSWFLWGWCSDCGARIEASCLREYAYSGWSVVAIAYRRDCATPVRPKPHPLPSFPCFLLPCLFPFANFFASLGPLSILLSVRQIGEIQVPFLGESALLIAKTAKEGQRRLFRNAQMSTRTFVHKITPPQLNFEEYPLILCSFTSFGALWGLAG